METLSKSADAAVRSIVAEVRTKVNAIPTTQAERAAIMRSIAERLNHED